MRYLKATVFFILFAVVNAMMTEDRQIIYSHLSDEAVRSIMSVIHPLEGELCVGALITARLTMIPKACMIRILNDIGTIYALVGLRHHASGLQHYFSGEHPDEVHHSYALGVLSEGILLTTYLELALPTSVIGGLISLGMDSERNGNAISFLGITHVSENELFACTTVGGQAGAPVASGSLLLYGGRLVGLADSFVTRTFNMRFQTEVSIHKFGLFKQEDLRSPWYCSIERRIDAVPTPFVFI